MQQDFETERLLLECRKRLSMTSVEEVVGFSEQTLKIKVKGQMVVVLGNGIKITAYNKQSGNLSADGEFFSIKYNQAKTPILKKILK